MKKLLLTLACAWMLCTASMKAQITLEYSNDSVTTNGEFYCTDIGNNDFKYFFYHLKSNSFSLYNMDMSPFMLNIPIPVSDSLKDGFKVIYITKTLFDCDSTNIEYVYELPVGGGLTSPFRIFRTDGTLLFQVDSARGPYAFGSAYGGQIDVRPIVQTSAGAKLFLGKYNAQWGSGTQVYSLCGELPVGMYDFSGNKNFVSISPNPASMQLNFEIMAPNNLDEFQLMIFDSEGREQWIENVSLMNKFYLNVSTFSSGTYLFSLVSNNKVWQTGKFILTK